MQTMISRRQVLTALAALSAGAAFQGTSFAGSRGQPKDESTAIHFGAQTNAWAIDPNSLDSFLDVLSQIRQVGYAGFETGYFNLTRQLASPGNAHSRIGGTRLAFFGVHIALPFEKNDSSTRIPPASLYEEVARGALAFFERIWIRGHDVDFLDRPALFFTRVFASEALLRSAALRSTGMPCFLSRSANASSASS